MKNKIAGQERGNILLAVVLIIVVISGLATAFMLQSVSDSREHLGAEKRMDALYVTESGISHAIADLSSGGTGVLGSQDVPVSFGRGNYWVWTVDNGDGTYVVTSNGYNTDGKRAIEVILMKTGGGIYDNAVFAGNSSGDPTYTMPFGGSGSQADSVTGDIYSGKNVKINGNAAVNGTIRASGDITGAVGQEGVTQPLPDIAGMNYAVNNDINVTQQMTLFGTNGSWTYGGTAKQLPQANPAHIFRMNPSDRVTETAATVKNDYFLEDKYAPFASDPNQNGASAAQIRLSGAGGQPGTPGNKKVYFIDGNLWVHNKSTYSFKFFTPEATGMQVTFVVKGNIYVSDNLFLLNKNKDGVAFIAMKDANVADSGNVYFGDPRFGTLKQMESFMYAENDFKDVNMDAAGSKKVTVIGNMTAGNKVDIQRDYGTQHSKLTVTLDDRISTGALTMPGLPNWKGSGQGNTFTVLSWREVQPTE